MFEDEVDAAAGGGGGGGDEFPPDDDVPRDQQLLGWIRNKFRQVEDAWDPQHQQPLISGMCPFLDLEKTGQNEFQFSSPDNDKVLTGNDAIKEAFRVYNLTLFEVLDEYKQWDAAIADFYWFGGESKELDCHTPNLKEMLHRLIHFGDGACKTLLSYRTSLVSACTSEGYNDLPPQAQSDRILAANNMHKLLAVEKQIKPAQFILTCAIAALRDNQFLIGDGFVYRRKMVEMRRFALYNGERLCKHCGEPESEHDNSGHVRDRKKHPFEPMTIVLGFEGPDGEMKPHMVNTHSYEKHMTISEFLERVCDPDGAFAMHTASMSSPQILNFVEARLCSMPSVPKLTPTRGFIGFEDGSWNVRDCRWHPYECKCHRFARPGLRACGDNGLWGDGIHLDAPPQIKNVFVNQFFSHQVR